jgi:(p)ppGpp synthase/HD superfamily hydrolase
MESVEKAKTIAYEIHKGQTRRDGSPYIQHPEWVAAQINHVDMKAVAWLHDTVEDGGMRAIALMMKKDIPWRIIQAVLLLSRIDNEGWMTYIKRLAGDEYARHVKILDLVHNVTDNPSAAARGRYRDALAYLTKRY